jgi:hypothetical protein
MSPSDRIHAALAHFKADQLLKEAQIRDSVIAELHRPVVTIVEENLKALSSVELQEGIGSTFELQEAATTPMHPEPPGGNVENKRLDVGTTPFQPRTERRRYAQLWAATISLAAIAAILASAAPFSPPTHKGPDQPASSQSLPRTSVSAHPTLVKPGSRRHASIKITETSWVSACTDGKQVFADLLTTKDRREFSFSSRAIVRVGNASGVDIALDGAPIGPLGGHGKLRRVEIGRSGFRLLPITSDDGDRDCENS